jgi:multidrug efflux pump
VTVQGNIRPSIRIQADLSRLANYGIALDDLRNVILAANLAGPKGALDGAASVLYHRRRRPDHRRRPYRNIIVTYRNGTPVLLKDVADVIDSLENTKVGGFYQCTPAIVVDIQRQTGANVIETVQHIKNELPKLQRAMPVGATLTVVHDATASIRASVSSSAWRWSSPSCSFYCAPFASLSSPASRCRSRHRDIRHYVVLRFSLDNFSLMAPTIGTGFVVDDAIVIIENIVRPYGERRASVPSRGES